jgi:toxin ParE1/3/4
MRVVWTADAEQDRADIWDYIAAVMLNDYPKIGKTGQIPDTRELVMHPSYRLVYEIENDTVWLLALLHTARQWLPIG